MYIFFEELAWYLKCYSFIIWYALFNIFVIANIIRYAFHNTWNELGIYTSIKDSLRFVLFFFFFFELQAIEKRGFYFFF